MKYFQQLNADDFILFQMEHLCLHMVKIRIRITF